MNGFGSELFRWDMRETEGVAVYLQSSAADIRLRASNSRLLADLWSGSFLEVPLLELLRGEQNIVWVPPYKRSSSRELLIPDQETVWPTSLSQGKVRQLFLERRGGKGFDKSNPLEPLKNKRNNNTVRNSELQTQSLSNLSDGNLALSQTLPDKAYFYKKLPNIGGTMQSKNAESTSAPTKKRISRIPQLNNSERLKSPTIPIAKDLRKLTISPRKPLGDDITTKPRSTEVKRFTPQLKKDEEKPRLQKVVNENRNSTPEIQLPAKVRTPVYSPLKSDKINTNSTPEKDKTPLQRNSNPDGPQCSICGRSFTADRLELHEKICKKSKIKKRKVFDPVKQRLAGTEAEGYLKKGSLQNKTTPQQVTTSKSNWRKKHEEFIANIRAAKQVKVHLAKGGKLSDLPPPPPLDTSDYVQCPHCGRKFNQSAAERHIPKCVNMRHNKTKKPIKK